MHPYWGATLYHPDDLPPGMLQPADSDTSNAAPGGSRFQPAYTRESSRFIGLPGTMTAFRKVRKDLDPDSVSSVLNFE